MNEINNIFKGIKEIEKAPNTIKSIPIDWIKHSNGILNIAKHIEPNFQVTENNAKALKLLLLYFTGNTQFETEFKEITGFDGSLNKGIMLIGGVGTGKSLLFKIFKQYTMNVLFCNSYSMHSSIDIIDRVTINGIKELDLFSHNLRDDKPDPITCYIDDIASKNEEVKNYGTSISVIEQLLSIRYNIFQAYGTITHTSTNLFRKQLKETYDLRVVDRLKEMFNIIELGGESFRK